MFYFLIVFWLMKRMIFLAAMAMACICVKAQFITESDLIGKWELEEGDEYAGPTSLWFKEDGTCVYTDFQGTLNCEGFVVSSTGQTLHLFSKNNFAGNTEFTMINLRLEKVGAVDDTYRTKLLLGSYDGKSWHSKFGKVVDNSAVRSITADPARGTKKYDLRGIATDSPKGVYIQDGKKAIGK